MQRHKWSSLSAASHVATARVRSGGLAAWMFVWLLGQRCLHDRWELTSLVTGRTVPTVFTLQSLAGVLVPDNNS